MRLLTLSSLASETSQVSFPDLTVQLDLPQDKVEALIIEGAVPSIRRLEFCHDKVSIYNVLMGTSVPPRIKKGGRGFGQLAVCALYIPLRICCLLMCTPGKKGGTPGKKRGAATRPPLGGGGDLESF